MELQERVIMVESWLSSVLNGELCVDNTYFEHRSLHKYKRVARGHGGVEIKRMIDLVVIKKDMLLLCRM